MSYQIKTRDQHFQSTGPKRILAMDGGGLRGIFTLGMLKRVEDILKARHGGSDEFRLAHYFDLIAGTSTGSIIAAALAVGMSVDEIIEQYNRLGKKVFRKTLLRHGVLRASYSSKPLIQELQSIFGADTKMRDEKLQTGFLAVTKRLDSGSPWPIGNNPDGHYFNPRPGSKTIANGDYPLWSVVRASTAAPTYFAGERIAIAKDDKGDDAVSGYFVDGGVSPFNNPTLQAVMYATLEGYRVGWPTGSDNLLVVSLGTGSDKVTREVGDVEAANGLAALQSLMDDNAALMETLLQWMSSSPTAGEIDRELGTLKGDVLGGRELMNYVRYNIPLTAEYLKQEFGLDLPADQAKDIAAMDAPDNMPILQSLGTDVGKQLIKEDHFPTQFDLN
ncbi:MAG: hypothetical protein HKN50_03140 [Gammaproteobacteria bacterium]|nr:hypothetical protein [Gammaproteobacteria bacterium]